MRRTVLLLASTALAVLLACGVALAATNEFSNPSAITIPERGAATPYPSAVSVSGLGTVTDVDLKLNGFSHEYPYDAEVELVGPSGASARVMSDVGGSSEVSNVNLTFDDEATSAVPDPLSSGTFRPSSPLSVFDGTNPNGVWELYVEDTSGGDAGRISGGWSLTITSEGAVEPLPADTTPPDTRLLEPLPSAISDNANPSFSFRSSETGSTFECKMDGGTYQPCSAPKRYFLLSEGQHNFEVRAKDASGNVDQTPAQHTWTVDSFDPKVTFIERPGTATGPSRFDEWVTNDRTPSWSWAVKDANPDPSSASCTLHDETNDRDIVDYETCSSPYPFEGELPDGDYYFSVDVNDKAGNYGYASNYFEVDTVAPKFVSGKPTGKRVSRYAWVEVTFNDEVYGWAKAVKIYKRGSNTPLAIRDSWMDEGEVSINPKYDLKRDTRYTVKVTTRVTDGANNLETPKTWSFKTK